MTKPYWEVKPEELDEEGLQKHIGDWWYNQVHPIGAWGKIKSREDLNGMRADISQLLYLLTMLDAIAEF